VCPGLGAGMRRVQKAEVRTNSRCVDPHAALEFVESRKLLGLIYFMV